MLRSEKIHGYILLTKNILLVSLKMSFIQSVIICDEIMKLLGCYIFSLPQQFRVKYYLLYVNLDRAQ